MSDRKVTERISDIKQALEEAKLLYQITGDLAKMVRDFEFVIAAYEAAREAIAASVIVPPETSHANRLFLADQRIEKYWINKTGKQ